MIKRFQPLSDALANSASRGSWYGSKVPFRSKPGYAETMRIKARISYQKNRILIEKFPKWEIQTPTRFEWLYRVGAY